MVGMHMAPSSLTSIRLGMRRVYERGITRSLFFFLCVVQAGGFHCTKDAHIAESPPLSESSLRYTMGFFKKPTLRTRDDQRTSAAELTLRASILPLCLVTILFFLWVCHVAVHELWLIYI